MGKKLYVGNLSYDTSSDELQQLFAAHGSVTSAEVIIDRSTGRSKGFGFVEMSSDDEAQAAINALNGREQNGRPLTVNEARPREDRPRGGGGGARSVIVSSATSLSGTESGRSLLVVPAHNEANSRSAQVDDDEDETPMICMICEDKATGLHYGIITCEG